MRASRSLASLAGAAGAAGIPLLPKLESLASSAVRVADKVGADLILVYTASGALRRGAFAARCGRKRSLVYTEP